MNGRRNLSNGQSSPSSKSDGFSSLKRTNNAIVARRFNGDNLLCSDKNISCRVISPHYTIKPEKQQKNAPKNIGALLKSHD